MIRGLLGLTAHSRSLGDRPDIRALSELLFDVNMVEMIVTYTNQKLLSLRERLGPATEQSNYCNTDDVEINAYIGVLLLSSRYYKDKK